MSHSVIDYGCFKLFIHFDPLMMAQNVGKMVRIFGEVCFEGNDVCFLGASYYVLMIV